MAGAPPHSILLGLRQLPLMRTVAMNRSPKNNDSYLAAGLAPRGANFAVNYLNPARYPIFPKSAGESNSGCSDF